MPPVVIRVWDIPVRLFHWLLVLLVIALFVTGKLGGNWLEWHQRAGVGVIGLVLFRVIWGFVGSTHARFASFLRGPSAVFAYVKNLRQRPLPHDIGHNPMGALSVVAMLLVLLAQAVLGLFANDDIMLEGPYARLVSKETSDFLTKLHKLNADVIIGLVCLHLAAIAFAYFYKKENLVKPMFTGEKASDSDAIPSIAPPIWRAWLVAAGVAIALYFVLKR